MSRRGAIYQQLMDERGHSLLAYAVTFVGDVDGGATLLEDAAVAALAWPRRIGGLQRAEHLVRVHIARLAVRRPPKPYSWSHGDPTLAALAQLWPKARACAILRFYDGLTPGQIAERLRISPSKAARLAEESGQVLAEALGVEPESLGEVVTVQSTWATR